MKILCVHLQGREELSEPKRKCVLFGHLFGILARFRVCLRVIETSEDCGCTRLRHSMPKTYATVVFWTDILFMSCDTVGLWSCFCGFKFQLQYRLSLVLNLHCSMSIVWNLNCSISIVGNFNYSISIVYNVKCIISVAFNLNYSTSIVPNMKCSISVASNLNYSISIVPNMKCSISVASNLNYSISVVSNMKWSISVVSNLNYSISMCNLSSSISIFIILKYSLWMICNFRHAVSIFWVSNISAQGFYFALSIYSFCSQPNQLSRDLMWLQWVLLGGCLHGAVKRPVTAFFHVFRRVRNIARSEY